MSEEQAQEQQRDFILAMVRRQTDYTEEHARKLLERKDWDPLAVIRNYNGTTTETGSSSEPGTVNQRIYKEIRGLMDGAAAAHRKDQEARQKKQAAISSFKAHAARVGEGTRPPASLVGAPENDQALSISVEFFPSKPGKPPPDARQLAELGPGFTCVTWGAGGSSAMRTPGTVEWCHKTTERPVCQHITCEGQSREDVIAAIDAAAAGPAAAIVCLRGDQPLTGEPRAGAMTCLELLQLVQKRHPGRFKLGCAAYPEGHPSTLEEVGQRDLSPEERGRVTRLGNGALHVCPDEVYEKELRYLVEKQEAGADFFLSQLFFDVGTFLRFFFAAARAGVTVPIIPALLPIGGMAAFHRITGLCKTRVPPAIAASLAKYDGDEEALSSYRKGLLFATCKALAFRGVRHFHFYAANQQLALVRETKEQLMEWIANPASREQAALSASS